MKRFDILTETEARVLEHGSTIVLAAGGHITPLALDTLRERRITVVRDGVDADSVALAPVASIRIVAVGGDHTSLGLKADLLRHLRSRGLTAEDLGTHTKDAVDYPDTAAKVALAVARGEAHAGIVIDGSGIGSSIAANKVAGVRAAMCPTPLFARYGREHNGINVIGLGSTILTGPEACAVVDAFVDTAMREPRYIRRLALIRELERRQR